VDAAQPDTINKGMHDAMWRGHGGWEMSLTPVLFGAIGWLIDGWIGSRPIVTVIAAVIGLAGSVANQYYQYNYRMEIAGAERRQQLESRR
jgi:hypothetical protein